MDCSRLLGAGKVGGEGVTQVRRLTQGLKVPCSAEGVQQPERSCTSLLTAARKKSVLFCTSLPVLRNRSMCWFSGARITSRGAEAKTVHSAGSKQDSTRCPSCSHKWHWQISLKGLKGVCKRWGKTQQCMDLWAPRGSFLHEVNSSSVLSGLLKNVTYVSGE